MGRAAPWRDVGDTTAPLSTAHRPDAAGFQLGSGYHHSDSPSTNLLAASPAELAISHGQTGDFREARARDLPLVIKGRW